MCSRYVLRWPGVRLPGGVHERARVGRLAGVIDARTPPVQEDAMTPAIVSYAGRGLESGRFTCIR